MNCRHIAKTLRPWVAVTTFLILPLACVTSGLQAQDVGTPVNNTSSEKPVRHALIVIGLPGDEERRTRFQQTSQTITRWFCNGLGASPSNVTVLSDDSASNENQSTAETIRRVAKELTTKLGRDDSLWVFLLGHGSEDQHRAWFHLPGPDMHATDWAGLFSELNAGEQVFWLTHSASGRFVKPFSLPDRVVIAATDEGEVNETLFPVVLSETMQKMLKVDEDANRSFSLLELFTMTAEEVQRRYDNQTLLATEHARLDDNGDGGGSELGSLAANDATVEEAEAAKATVDGFTASKIRIQLSRPEKPQAPTTTSETARE